MPASVSTQIVCDERDAATYRQFRNPESGKFKVVIKLHRERLDARNVNIT